jgi:hypothetical protein
MARPSARTEKGRGDTKAGAPTPYGLKEEEHGRLTTATGASPIQGTPPCPAVMVKEISEGIV